MTSILSPEKLRAIGDFRGRICNRKHTMIWGVSLTPLEGWQGFC
jgi:hypothetical protein